MASANERGYGYAHLKLRRQLMAALQDGDPCARCALPMDRSQPLELDHTDDRTGYLGLSHLWCNRAGRPATPFASLRGRICVECGGEYRAGTQSQQFCSRKCSNDQRQRNRGRPLS